MFDTPQRHDTLPLCGTPTKGLYGFVRGVHVWVKSDLTAGLLSSVIICTVREDVGVGLGIHILYDIKMMVDGVKVMQRFKSPGNRYKGFLSGGYAGDRKV